MERVVSATEARVHFGELIRTVVETETPVVVERDGRPQVVVLSVSEYERLRSAPGAGATWQALLERAHALTRKELGRRRLPAADDVIRALRDERDADLARLR